MGVLHRFHNCRSGATAVEFAIVGLFLVLVSISVIDFGRGLHLRNKIAYAADVGARRILNDPNVSNGAVESSIRAVFTRPNPGLLHVAIASESVNGSGYRTVSITYPLSFLIPGLSGSGITLNVVRRIPLI